MEALFLCLAIVAGNDAGITNLSKDRLVYACENTPNIIKYAEKANIDSHHLAALIYIESHWKHNARSHANACGLTQVLPKYVKWSCKELYNPETSIQAGALCLSKWIKKRNKKPKEALACYNAGNLCSKSRTGRNYAKKVIRISNFYKNWKKLHYQAMLFEHQLVENL